MARSRTLPDKSQAQELLRYFEYYFSARAKWASSHTEEQRAHATAELKEVSLKAYSAELPDVLYKWSINHVNAKTYSNAIRAANKRLSKLAGEKHYKPLSERPANITVKYENKYRLELLKEMNSEIDSLDGALAKALDDSKALAKLERFGDTLMISERWSSTPSIDEIIDTLISNYEANRKKPHT